MTGVNVWWMYLAPQNIRGAIVLTLGNKVVSLLSSAKWGKTWTTPAHYTPDRRVTHPNKSVFSCWCSSQWEASRSVPGCVTWVIISLLALEPFCTSLLPCCFRYPTARWVSSLSAWRDVPTRVTARTPPPLPPGCIYVHRLNTVTRTRPVHVRAHARTHACTHARLRAYTHTHTHTHARTHARTHAPASITLNTVCEQRGTVFIITIRCK